MNIKGLIATALEDKSPGIISRYGIFYDETVDYPSWRVTANLPDPIYNGILIAARDTMSAAENAANIIHILQLLENDQAQNLQKYHSMVESVKSGLTCEYPKLLSSKVAEVVFHEDEIEMCLEFQFEIIGATLIPEVRTYVLPSADYPRTHIVNPNARLKKSDLVSQQEGLVPYGQLKSDQILAPILKNLGIERLGKLRDLLSQDPRRSPSQADYHKTAWRARDFSEHNFQIPESLTRMTADRGIFRGDFHLAKGIGIITKKNETSLVLKQSIPRSIVMKLAGQSIRKVVEHPLLPDMLIDKKIRIKDQMVIFPLKTKYINLPELPCPQIPEG